MKITVELRMLILLAAQPFIKYTVWDSNQLSNNDDDHSCSRKSTKLQSGKFCSHYKFEGRDRKCLRVSLELSSRMPRGYAECTRRLSGPLG